ncbi:MAG: hypothetical protein JWQ35_2500 [Bacteriovoracaceae bacterium]|nr:hypothetical protein [Bacteriovoracaceae bacterium]
MIQILFLVGLLSFPNVLSATDQKKLPVEFIVNGKNITDEYKTTLKQEKPDQDAFLTFKNYKVLLVPGFLSNEIRDLKVVPHSGKVGDYFDDQMKWLKSQEIDHLLVEINSEETNEFNAKLIRKEIENSDRPVIIISHSKGGLDTLEALLFGDEAIRTKVKAWVPLNSPFQGTPLADAFLKNQIVRYMVEKTVEALGGKIGSVQSMTLNARFKYQEKNQIQIKALLQKTKTISLATWKKHESNRIDSTLELIIQYIESLGYENDGAVPWKSAVLADSEYVVIEGVDHLMTIQETPFSSFDRTKMTEALFLMLAKRL